MNLKTIVGNIVSELLNINDREKTIKAARKKERKKDTLSAEKQNTDFLQCKVDNSGATSLKYFKKPVNLDFSVAQDRLIFLCKHASLKTRGDIS